jgi:hypothetical protein
VTHRCGQAGPDAYSSLRRATQAESSLSMPVIHLLVLARPPNGKK